MRYIIELLNLNVINSSLTDFQNIIISSILIIILGFVLGRLKVFTNETAHSITNILLNLTFPALCFTAFIQDIDKNIIMQSMSLLIFGFIVYIVLILTFGKLYFNYKEDPKIALTICTIFGSTTTFGFPIVYSLYGSEGLIYANIFNLSYRVFLYSYALIKMSGIKFRLENIHEMIFNPILFSTFLGLIVWIFQDNFPHISIEKNNIVSYVSIVRIDHTLPSIFHTLKLLASLTSALAWLSIGITLSNLSIKSALLSKTSWYYSFNKVIFLPLLTLLVLIALKYFNVMDISYIAVVAVVILMATPTGAVVAAYSLKYDKAPVLISNCYFLSTVLSLILISLWIIIIEILKSAGILF